LLYFEQYHIFAHQIYKSLDNCRIEFFVFFVLENFLKIAMHLRYVVTYEMAVLLDFLLFFLVVMEVFERVIPILLLNVVERKQLDV